jgi:hypothetical protein
VDGGKEMMQQEEETYTPEERIKRLVELKPVDRIGVGPQIVADAARYAGMSIAEYCLNIESAKRAHDEAYEKIGRPDMCMPMPLGPMFYFPFSIALAYSFFTGHWKFPGITPGYPEDRIYQFIETDIFGKDGYDTLIKDGMHRFIRFDEASARDVVEKAFPAAKFSNDWLLEFKERHIPMWGTYGYSMGMSECPLAICMAYRGIENLVRDVMYRPDKLIEFAEETNDALIAIAEQGALMGGIEPLTIWNGGFGSWSTDFISPKSYLELVHPYLKKMIHTYVKDGFMVHCHWHNNITPLLEYLKEVIPKKSSVVLYIDNLTDIAKTKEILGDHVCIMGNITPSTLTVGTPKDVEKEVKKVIDAAKGDTGFILSVETGDDTKLENMQTLVRVGKEYGKYRR